MLVMKNKIIDYSTLFHRSEIFKHRTIGSLIPLVTKKKTWDLQPHEFSFDILCQMIYQTEFNVAWIGYDYVGFLADLFRYPHETLSIIERFTRLRLLGAARTEEYFCLKYGDELGKQKFKTRVERTVRELNRTSKASVELKNKNRKANLQALLESPGKTLSLSVFDKFASIIDQLDIKSKQKLLEKCKTIDIPVLPLHVRVLDETNCFSAKWIIILNLLIRNNPNRSQSDIVELFREITTTVNWFHIPKYKILIYGTNHRKNYVGNPANARMGRVSRKLGFKFFLNDRDIIVRLTGANFDKRVSQLVLIYGNHSTTQSISERINALETISGGYKRFPILYGDNHQSYTDEYRRIKNTCFSKISKMTKNEIIKRLDHVYGLKSNEINELFVSNKHFELMVRSMMPKAVKLIKDLIRVHGNIGDNFEKWRTSKNRSERFIIRYGEQAYIAARSDATAKRDASMAKKGKQYSTSASKESIEFFTPIYESLLDLDPKMWIYLGAFGRREYRLAEIINQKPKHYFYDFTLPQYKLIVEYNGHKWHPRRSRLQQTEWDNWVNPRQPSMRAEDKEQHDLAKIATANKYGFILIEVWDDEPKEQAYERVRLALKRVDLNIDIFENKMLKFEHNQIEEYNL